MPHYRNLLNRNTELLRQEKQFDVEYPGRKVLVRENLLSGRARKEFESALSVTNVTDADDAEDRMEAVHEDVA